MAAIQPLKSGDTIGVIALSSPCAPDALARGIKKIESAGFRARVALDPCKFYGRSDYLFSSDTAENRARALEQLFKDKEVKAIIAARGAYGSMEVLPLFDFELVKTNPKPLIGFSDTTAFLIALTKLSAVPSIHGPALTGAFAASEDDQQAQQSSEVALKLLKGEITNPFLNLSFQSLSSAANGSGELVGGSLTLLSSMLGTAWELETKGKILFVEECGEKPYRVLRVLTQLRLAGKFEGLKGVLLGSFKDCHHANGPDVSQVLESVFQDQPYPVLKGVPFGHEALNFAIPLGVHAEIASGQISRIDSLFA